MKGRIYVCVGGEVEEITGMVGWEGYVIVFLVGIVVGMLMNKRHGSWR